MRLPEIQSEVAAAVQRLWPGVPVKVEFLPLADLALGIAGSDLPLQLAALLKIEAAAAGAKLLCELPGRPEVNWKVADGFLNLQALDPRRLGIQFESPADGRQHALVLPPRAAWIGELAWLRVAALALIQWSLLRRTGCEVALYIQGAGRLLGTEELGAAELFRLILDNLELQKPLAAGADCRAALAELVQLAGPESRTTIWLLPRSFSRRDYFSFVTGIGAGPGLNRRVRCPEQTWLSGNLPRQFTWRDWSDSDAKALILYLAGPVFGVDLDFQVPRSNERGNLHWYATSTRERLVRLWDESRLQFQFAGAIEPLSCLERELLSRLLLLPEFSAQAAVAGETGRLVFVLEDLLVLLNRLFNAPAFRIRLERGLLRSAECQILSGVLQLLSDMIDSWELLH